MCDFSKAVWVLSAQGNDFQPWQTCQFGFSSAAIKLSFCEVLVNFFYRPPCNVSSNSIWVLQGSRRLQYCSARSFFAWSWRHSLLLLDVTQEMLEKTPGGFSFSLFLHWHAFFSFVGDKLRERDVKRFVNTVGSSPLNVVPMGWTVSMLCIDLASIFCCFHSLTIGKQSVISEGTD